MGAASACRRRMCAIARKIGPIQSEHTIFHHRAYIRIYYVSLLRHNNVVINVRIYPHMGVCICMEIMETQEKKLDISPFLYILLIITVFALAV